MQQNKPTAYNSTNKTKLKTLKKEIINGLKSGDPTPLKMDEIIRKARIPSKTNK